MDIAALERQPYDTDPDLAWQPPPGPELVYDGDVPDDVVALAQARRRTVRGEHERAGAPAMPAE